MNFLAPHRAVVAGLALLISPAGWGAEPEKTSPDAAKPAADGHRFLFVVETSADNRKSEEANRQAAFDLIVGGVSGQMRTGDSFGIWTFSDDVRAGEFPMTVYASERALEIAGQVATFLQSRRYSKRPDFQPLIKQLRALADSVSDFNVFILSSGQHRMEGTPFDQNINSAYEAFKKRPAKLARIPLVTSFIVRKGRPSGGSVVLAGERIDLPDRPPALAQTPSHTTNATLAATGSTTTGSSPPGNATATTNPLTNPPPTLPKVFQIITHSNQLNPSLAATTNHQSPPARMEIDPAAQATVAVATALPAKTPEDATAPVRETSTKPQPETITPATQSSPGPVADTKPTPDHTTYSYSVTAITSILAAAANAATETPVRVAAREPAPRQAAKPPTETAPASTGVPAVAATAMVPSSAIGLSPVALLAIGGTLLGATCLLVILVLRRTPPATRGSLISQSMRRE